MAANSTAVKGFCRKASKALSSATGGLVPLMAMSLAPGAALRRLDASGGPARPGNLQIGKQDGGLLGSWERGEDVQRRVAGLSQQHIVAFGTEDEREQIAHDVIVVDD